MTITTSSDSKIIGFCIFNQVFQAQNCGRNEGVFRGILHILAPISKFCLWVHLYTYELAKTRDL